MNKVIVIAGPTASGKTALSLDLALRLGGEIVSADSMQIYRRMDIGTAKATPEEQAIVPHHMIDIVDPGENYSVARYVEEASACCEDILSRGKVPVITGGTGLYIDSLLSGRDFGEYDGSESLREELNSRYDNSGGEKMLSDLKEFDPERASILHASDKKRIVRAFEVYILSGETITAHDERTKSIPPRYSSLYMIPGFTDRSLLYNRIDLRVDEMMSSGLVSEVKALLESGLSAECTAMQAIGYKETAQHLDGSFSLPEATDLIKQASRRYAKRQLTWFNRHAEAFRLYHDSAETSDIREIALSAAKEFLK
ncbi:MAG: tRNA (adenosine(37)-N6)-dimethylallyltransferase MiaA [Eubacteriales bacterium]|nr:tRNA (adenosine(37)-N6)-dimethylallyltransferase MiaA [Eubacteriales bacterium]